MYLACAEDGAHMAARADGALFDSDAKANYVPQQMSEFQDRFVYLYGLKWAVRMD